jgi:hypothetical protein
MDTVTPEKKTKTSDKKYNYSTIRVRRDFAKKFNTELDKINEKKHGRRVRGDELIAHLLTFLTNEGRRALQEATMSNQDQFERDYLEYCSTHQKISKDEYLGKRLSGELPPPRHQRDGKATEAIGAVENSGGK